MKSAFKQAATQPKRLEASGRLLTKYPGRVPTIVELAPGCTFPLSRTKYLVPGEITVGKFILEIRKHMHVEPSAAVFLYINGGVLPPTAAIMSQIYSRYKDSDNFLYITIASENTFG